VGDKLWATSCGRQGAGDAVRLKLTIEYDGSAFHGWARQPGKRTVETELRRALAELYASCGNLAVAGRTDAGVHALANVVSVEVAAGPPPERAAEALNAALPGDVAVVTVEPAPADFDARFSARARSYRYRVWRPRVRSAFELRRSWWNTRPLDVRRLQASAAMLAGEHDFRAFTPTETQHGVFVRMVEDARWIEDGPVLAFEVTADSFLRHMVRTLVGTMLEREPQAFTSLLRGAPRSEAGSTAPPWGLYLTGVRY
jgi:tRNA pseudouridine38-40 synthase